MLLYAHNGAQIKRTELMKWSEDSLSPLEIRLTDHEFKRYPRNTANDFNQDLIHD